MAKFSIIIPCYNRYELMGKCLQSLEEQTFKDFEVVIVDDCSTDDSFEKLEKYKENSKLNIKLLKNEKNLGAGLARNQGIKKANAEYVLFLDSDDYFEINALEILNNVLLENDVDCIMFDYYFRANRSVIKQKTISKHVNGIISKKDALIYSTGSTAGKVYLLENIKNNNIEFPNLKRNEDMPFNKLAISVSNSIFYCDKPLYNYVDNKNSLMNDKELADENNAIKAFEILYDKLNDKYPEEIEAIFLKQYLYSTTMTLIRKKVKINEVKKHVKKCEEKYTNIYKNESIKSMTKYQKICIFAIKKKMFFILKILINIKLFIKKIR